MKIQITLAAQVSLSGSMDILLRDLKSYDACDDAIENIRMDPRNCVGGSKAFYSGRRVELTAAAKKKIAQIDTYRDKNFPTPDDD